MLDLPISLIVAHWVGDFLLQSDWMALNKSKNTWEGTAAIVSHAFVYSLCFSWLGLAFVLFTFSTHLATDWVTSRITSKLWFIEMEKVSNRLWYAYDTKLHLRHWFFVAIGADQVIHYVTLALTLRFLA